MAVLFNKSPHQVPHLSLSGRLLFELAFRCVLCCTEGGSDQGGGIALLDAFTMGKKRFKATWIAVHVLHVEFSSLGTS